MKATLLRLALPGLALLATACAKDSGGPAAPAPQSRIDPRKSSPDTLPPSGFYNNADGSPLFPLLNGAARTIDIEIYQMSDADVRAALRKALARGVRVRVVKEPSPLGDHCDVFEPLKEKEDAKCAEQKKLRAEILATGGAYVPFDKASLCADPAKTCFEHGKLAIADGAVALVSTGNFNASNLCNHGQSPGKCNRDFSVIQRDPDVLALLGQVFENDLKAQKYDLKAMLEASPAREKVTVSPLSLAPLVALVGSATTSLRIENQYLKEKTLNEAITAAAARGVRVEVTLASLCSFGALPADQAKFARELYAPMLAAGVSLRFLPSQFQIGGRPGYLHAKSITVDGSRAWVGSVNGSISATSNNREFGVFFSDDKNVSLLEAVLTSDHASPDMETLDETLACAKDKGDGGGDEALGAN